MRDAEVRVPRREAVALGRERRLSEDSTGLVSGAAGGGGASARGFGSWGGRGPWASARAGALPVPSAQSLHGLLRKAGRRGAGAQRTLLGWAWASPAGPGSPCSHGWDHVHHVLLGTWALSQPQPRLEGTGPPVPTPEAPQPVCASLSRPVGLGGLTANLGRPFGRLSSCPGTVTGNQHGDDDCSLHHITPWCVVVSLSATPRSPPVPVPVSLHPHPCVSTPTSLCSPCACVPTPMSPCIPAHAHPCPCPCLHIPIFRSLCPCPCVPAPTSRAACSVLSRTLPWWPGQSKELAVPPTNGSPSPSPSSASVGA